MKAEDQARILAIARTWWPEREYLQPTAVADMRVPWYWAASPTTPFVPIPDFVHDWAAMGLLLERVKEKGWRYHLEGDGDEHVAIFRLHHYSYHAGGPTLPEAVAAAAEAVPQAEIDRALEIDK